MFVIAICIKYMVHNSCANHNDSLHRPSISGLQMAQLNCNRTLLRKLADCMWNLAKLAVENCGPFRLHVTSTYTHVAV